MSRRMRSAVNGALAGFAVGYLAFTGLALWGLVPPGYLGLVLAALGAAAGGTAGASLHSPSRGARVVARWCVVTAAVVGGLGFLAGFIGPMLLRPGSPQGPLLGIFFTGPLGCVLGAAVGAVLGVIARGLSRPARPGVVNR